jgi:hypothetical protein
LDIAQAKESQSPFQRVIGQDAVPDRTRHVSEVSIPFSAGHRSGHETDSFLNELARSQSPFQRVIGQDGRELEVSDAYSVSIPFSAGHRSGPASQSWTLTGWGLNPLFSGSSVRTEQPRRSRPPLHVSIPFSAGHRSGHHHNGENARRGRVSIPFSAGHRSGRGSALEIRRGQPSQSPFQRVIGQDSSALKTLADQVLAKGADRDSKHAKVDVPATAQTKLNGSRSAWSGQGTALTARHS